MRTSPLVLGTLAWLAATVSYPADFTPAPQRFRQEVPTRFTQAHGLPEAAAQLIDLAVDGTPRAFAGGKWWELRDGRWQPAPR